MKNPLVSVVITTKNEEKDIGRFLESMKKQSYENIESIVVDNNSKDKTKEIARKYTKKIYNKGPERSVQRNFGVSKAKGKYVLILDADMELTKNVVKSCIEVITDSKHKALIVPEKTVGDNFMAKVRDFEREMYMGDLTIEVARFFEKGVFKKFGGYDADLTGTEDYDLPKRISEKYSIGWSKEYILHHEENLTLFKQLKKKFYYANRSALYVDKHPDLIKTQGNMLFRKAYFRNWKKFIKKPLLGVSFIFIRVLETTAAISGYIKAVGFVKFLKTLLGMFNS